MRSSGQLLPGESLGRGLVPPPSQDHRTGQLPGLQRFHPTVLRQGAIPRAADPQAPNLRVESPVVPREPEPVREVGALARGRAQRSPDHRVLRRPGQQSPLRETGHDGRGGARPGETLGLKHFLYTSFSHTAAKHKVRIMIPISRPMTYDEAYTAYEFFNWMFDSQLDH